MAGLYNTIFSSPVFITVSILVNKRDNCFVEPFHCFTGDYAAWRSNIGKVISCHRQTVQYQETS